jgi:DNA repair exonuclease SbcCD ATPase subunit
MKEVLAEIESDLKELDHQIRYYLEKFSIPNEDKKELKYILDVTDIAKHNAHRKQIYHLKNNLEGIINFAEGMVHGPFLGNQENLFERIKAQIKRLEEHKNRLVSSDIFKLSSLDEGIHERLFNIEALLQQLLNIIKSKGFKEDQLEEEISEFAALSKLLDKEIKDIGEKLKVDADILKIFAGLTEILRNIQTDVGVLRSTFISHKFNYRSLDNITNSIRNYWNEIVSVTISILENIARDQGIFLGAVGYEKGLKGVVFK